MKHLKHAEASPFVMSVVNIPDVGIDDSDPSALCFTAEEGSRATMCLSCSLQIVAQKKMVKPLLLKYGKYAGKSTITVDFLHCAFDLDALVN